MGRSPRLFLRNSPPPLGRAAQQQGEDSILRELRRPQSRKTSAGVGAACIHVGGLFAAAALTREFGLRDAVAAIDIAADCTFLARVRRWQIARSDPERIGQFSQSDSCAEIGPGLPKSKRATAISAGA